MSRRTNAFALSFLAVLWLGDHPAVGGQISTPLQTQSIPVTQTDWGPGTGGPTFPVNFTQFNPKLGTLDAVAITLDATLRNTYELIFVNTPTMTTISVENAQALNPNVGPTVTVYAPDGVTQIFGSPGTSVPVDLVSRTTDVHSTYSSSLPVTSPYYIPPTDATISLSRSLDSSNAATLLPEFIGKGIIDLPITAMAYSSFTTSSGNGGGAVTTDASATVTLQYWFTAASIPEPSSLILLGLGAGLTALADCWRRRAAVPARGDRA